MQCEYIASTNEPKERMLVFLGFGFWDEDCVYNCSVAVWMLYGCVTVYCVLSLAPI